MQPAIINATPEQRTHRSIARVKKLRQALERAQAKGHPPERIEGLRAEIVSRMEELEQLRGELDSLGAVA